MAKINDKIFCSGENKHILYIISVEPLQIIQKINLGFGDDNEFGIIRFIYNSNDGFILTSPEDEIIQCKVVVRDGAYNSTVLTAGNGRIFYKQKKENMKNKINLYLTKYKKLDK